MKLSFCQSVIILVHRVQIFVGQRADTRIQEIYRLALFIRVAKIFNRLAKCFGNMKRLIDEPATLLKTNVEPNLKRCFFSHLIQDQIELRLLTWALSPPLRQMRNSYSRRYECDGRPAQRP